MNHTTCGNCDAPLSGPYCAQCGQHVHDSARTLGVLLHDGWHVLTHLDGRVWATLKLLLAKPGRLTVEYFAARRARYVPPVRLYIVVSVLLFAAFSVTVHDRGPPRGLHAPAATPATAPAAPTAAPAPPAASPATAAATDGEAAGAGDVELDVGGVELSHFQLTRAECSRAHSNWAWMTALLRTGCERAAAAGAREVLHTLRANLPRMMFVFLPLMAAVMSLLYWFPRRYYVEHLVFFLHNHAALYVAMALQLAVGLLAAAVPRLGALEGWSIAALALYAPWYVYRAMRTFYGQGRWLTLAKIALVSSAYVMFLFITLLGALLYSALTT